MSLKEAVIQKVDEEFGPDTYREARSLHRPDLHSSETSFGLVDLYDLSEAIVDALSESNESMQNKIGAFFEIYDDIPKYTLLHCFGLSLPFREWDSAERQQFWECAIPRLDDPNPHLAPGIAYCMWCDWFEDSELAVKAWPILTSSDVPSRALQQVLISSGPVPWSLKCDLYARLVTDIEWHYYIFQSILHSVFDYFGQYDREEALQWLQKLTLDPDTEDLAHLRRQLWSRVGF
jgi:hypothetical protein